MKDTYIISVGWSWPADLAVSGLILTGSGNLSNSKQGSFAQKAFHNLLSSSWLDLSALEKDVKSQVIVCIKLKFSIWNRILKLPYK